MLQFAKTRKVLLFFYFAGHGYQKAGELKLILTDNSEINFDKEVTMKFLHSDDALIALLDCCRNFDNDKASEVAKKIGRMNLSGARGITGSKNDIYYPVRPGALVGYSTDPDTSASDYGFYTKYVMKGITSPNKDIVSIFKEAKTKTMHKCGQCPSYVDGLSGDIFLVKEDSESSESDDSEDEELFPSRLGTRSSSGYRNCQGITQKGTQCTRKALEGSRYCHQHA
jgi:hypothetical protein